jgi:ATP-dependent DNA helicase RecQ
MTDKALQLLQQYFGFTEFRLGQAQVVNSILAGESAAAIFPTGSGKSLCYQLPALELPALTLLVSPLLALMQDQLDFLNKKGISAASIDSTQTREEANKVMAGVREGSIKILMISVERLNNERFRQFISQVSISLLVVDEAHCISEWGHNFRPDYLKLPQYRREFNIQQTLLLTATATPQVIEDMGKKFGIEQKNITLTGFYRANLNLHVQGVTSQQKIDILGQWLTSRIHQSGIVYVTLQQTAEDVASALRKQNIPAQAYHAGMDHDRRQQIQQRFMASDKGVIVATIAFGMGVDKSNIRFVAHYDLPKSIENYAQEIGRAGRDGHASDCLVLANRDNLNVLENFVYGDTPQQNEIRFVLNDILNPAKPESNEWELVLNSLSSQSNIRPLSLKTLLVYLELFKVIKPLYSYFAEYKFKFIKTKDELLRHFDHERLNFVNAIFESAQMAKIWGTIDFEQLYQVYPSERSRVITALNYMDEQGFIELQTKQMTQVYEVLKQDINIDAFSLRLFQRFNEKEQSEIKRIHKLMAFFESKQCLSHQLGHYFADKNVPTHCGHCSVCAGQTATFPPLVTLKPLNEFDFIALSGDIRNKLADRTSPVLVSRFFCGLTTPIFTRLKVRTLTGFRCFEHYRFVDVKNWVEQHMQKDQ